MRCRICQIPHRNTSRYDLWTEHRICRLCAGICDYFAWNGNYLRHYWGEGGDGIEG